MLKTTRNTFIPKQTAGPRQTFKYCINYEKKNPNSYQQNSTSNLSVFGQINTAIDKDSQAIYQLFQFSTLPRGGSLSIYKREQTGLFCVISVLVKEKKTGCILFLFAQREI